MLPFRSPRISEHVYVAIFLKRQPGVRDMRLLLLRDVPSSSFCSLEPNQPRFSGTWLSDRALR